MSDTDPLLFLHRALLDGEPTASRRFADACGPRLHALLKRRHGMLPREIVTDAATDALLFLIRYPERYQSERGSLLNFLLHIADNKIRDVLRAIQRQKVEFVGGNVELELVEAKQYREETEPSIGWSDPDILPPEIEALLQELLPDGRDREIWALVCQGRGETAEFASLLNLTHLPLAEQKAEVKRHRDRVIKRIQRHREEFRRLLL